MVTIELYTLRVTQQEPCVKKFEILHEVGNGGAIKNPPCGRVVGLTMRFDHPASCGACLVSGVSGGAIIVVAQPLEINCG